MYSSFLNFNKGLSCLMARIQISNEVMSNIICQVEALWQFYQSYNIRTEC